MAGRIRKKVDNMKGRISNESKEIRYKQEELLSQLPNDKVKPQPWLNPRAKKYLMI